MVSSLLFGPFPLGGRCKAQTSQGFALAFASHRLLHLPGARGPALARFACLCTCRINLGLIPGSLGVASLPNTGFIYVYE